MNDLWLYQVKPEYLRFLHGIEKRVSMKENNRPFVGIVTMINGIEYLIPLTSRTTKERKKSGKKKRSTLITTFVRDSSGEEIANLLHNNMIPVKEGLCTKLSIDPLKETYESNEIRYIRKNQDKIIAKAQKVHDRRVRSIDHFLQKVCCDFELLEKRFHEFDIDQVN